MVERLEEETIYLTEEWHARRIVMEATLKILSDGKPHSSRHILDELIKRGITIPKRLVNSVLFSEARRYVSYDKRTFTYQLRQVERTKIDGAIENLSQAPLAADNVSNGATQSQVIRARYIGRNDEYVFSPTRSTGPAFFDTSAKSRTIEIRINEQHPLFADLDELLVPVDDTSGDHVRNRFVRGQEVLKLLLAAWAKYENDLPDGPRKFKAQEARLEWGRNARLLLVDNLDEED